MDPAERLARHVVETKYSNIAATKRCVLDTFAAALAGSAAVETEIIVGLLREWRGAHESAVFNHDVAVPAHHAALANATMARAFDIDDVLEKASLHVHASVVPSALAVAERVKNVSGEEFLAAAAVGADIVARMGQANVIPTAVSGMNSTYQYGTFGTAAACGKLLRLDEDHVLHALGIAYGLVAGNSQSLVEGAMTTSRPSRVNGPPVRKYSQRTVRTAPLSLVGLRLPDRPPRVIERR